MKTNKPKRSRDIPVDVSKLIVGETYKNYGEICNALGEKTKGGRSKELRTEDWERYFKFTKTGHKYVIDKIYDEPFEKVFNYQGGNNAVKYIDVIEYLILDLLTRQSNQHVFISKNKLLQALKMTNSEYSKGKYALNKLSKEIDIDINEIKDFYSTSDSVLQSNVETALRRLDNKALIIWNLSKTVAIVETDVDFNLIGNVPAHKVEKTDRYGDTSVEFNTGNGFREIEHRKATPDERSEISRAEKEVLELFGYEEKYDLFLDGKRDEYYKRVTNLLLERLNISMYYNSYEITFHESHLHKEMEKQKYKMQQSIKDDSHRELNNDVADRLIANAENRRQNASVKYNETRKLKYRNRMSFEYMSNFNKLVDKLIRIDDMII